MAPPAEERSERVLEAEFRAIVRDFGRNLYGQAYRTLGDAEQATDAVQEILLNIHRSLRDFRGDSTLTTWVYRIALNTLFGYRRRQRNLPLPLADADIAERVIDEEGDLEKEIDAKETRELLARCIAKLPPQESAAITLFYMDGFSYKEIASILDASLGSVGILLHRGREHLHVLLTEKKKRVNR